MYNSAVQMLTRKTFADLNFTLDPKFNFFPPMNERYEMHPYWLNNIPCQILLFIVPLYIAFALLRGLRRGSIKTILILTFWHCLAIFPMYIGFFFGRHESTVQQDVIANALFFSLQFLLLINGCIAVIALGFETCPNTGTFWTFKSMGYLILISPSFVTVLFSFMLIAHGNIAMCSKILIGQSVLLVLIMITMFFRTPSILYNLEHLIFIILLQVHPLLIALFPHNYSLKLSQCFYVCILISLRFVLEPFLVVHPLIRRRGSFSSEQ